MIQEPGRGICRQKDFKLTLGRSTGMFFHQSQFHHTLQHRVDDSHHHSRIVYNLANERERKQDVSKREQERDGVRGGEKDIQTDRQKEGERYTR